MKRYIILSVITLLCSCSTMIIPEQVIDEVDDTTQTPLTKGYELQDSLGFDKSSLKLQKNKFSMLMNHVVFKNGEAILSFTDKDLVDLGIETLATAFEVIEWRNYKLLIISVINTFAPVKMPGREVITRCVLNCYVCGARTPVRLRICGRE